ncbi:hypothetical protein BC939DRAFT_500679 [Gamsiella multidivaricata]|uniref:uncharacterized protein n=1 Tax=Gamsiella multidivaricata TaxID=101098 RepID=UPI00221FB697|nr:uncharacterized protein BC939DRAFT_500679 [Gamsiella multidivaricata]KAG0360081.1 hypothetical protein BGZ54_009712 [Gamsiella multidivaricata]KAI7828565.1 hypothetical protein BC939DRAFT_500679 [Gamsiella multidivaricata]
MSRRALRGPNPSSPSTSSRETSDQEEEQRSFLSSSTSSYSTPVAKRKHRQQHPTRINNAVVDGYEDEDDNGHHMKALDSTLLPHRSNSPKNNDNGSLPDYSHHPKGSLDDEISVATLTAAAVEPLSIVLTAPVLMGESDPSSQRHSHERQRQQVAAQQHPSSSSSSSSSAERGYSKWSTIGHQASFLATGIFSTIAVQWLYYQGAASGTTMLTVFFNYIGMMSVGLVYALQSWWADRKQRRLATAAGCNAHVEYDVLTTDFHEMTETHPRDVEDQGIKSHVGLLVNKTGSTSNNNSNNNNNNNNNGSKSNHDSVSNNIGHCHEDENEDEDDDDDYDNLDMEKQRLRKIHTGDHSMDVSDSSSKTAEKKSKLGLHWPVIQVAVMDVIANALVTIGFFYVGSGMYQVIYSSIVIWCAILTRIFLARELNNIQWLSIVGVTFGLAISAVGTVQDASPDGPVQSWLEKSFGALVTLGATFLYACVYVLSDKVLSTFRPKPIPEKVCSMVGGYASLLTFVYLCIHTIPNWQTEVIEVVQEHQGSWLGIALVYPLVTISSMLHSLNYYVLLSRINNIAVGIMQSLRAVLVFVMSHYLFCGVSSAQCFNEWKFISAIVVIGCVTLFSFNSNPAAPGTDDTTTTVAGSASVKTSTPTSRVTSPIPRLSSTRQRNAH